jgi:hypothetical protein
MVLHRVHFPGTTQIVLIDARGIIRAQVAPVMPIGSRATTAPRSLGADDHN